ncbi:MAG: Gfo/Idh/MocA family oxidoreductase [Candidatus Brockarchaeota archaeon]|nr:Gfo/Idh/MocA family oxidoreductase [Candidatus Brockarchaeota archaeon]
MTPFENGRCGILGCGVVALRYIPYVKKYGDLVAVCDKVPERAANFKNFYGAKKYYTDFNDMLSEPDIDIVFILTGMSIHAKQVAQAARAKKHILVQKPLATNMEDLKKAVEEVKKNRVKVLVEPNVQQSPLYLKAKEVLEDGVLGEVLWFRAGLGRGPPAWGSETFFSREAGGPLFDLGVYEISAITFLLGPAKRVVGMAKTSVPETTIVPDETVTEILSSSPVSYMEFFNLLSRYPKSKKIRVTAEDNTFTCLEMENGSLGCIISNFITPYEIRFGEGDAPRIEIYGTIGALFIWQDRLAVKTEKKTSRYYGDSWYVIPMDDVQWDYMEASTKHIIECVAEDKDPLPNISWGAHVSEIMIKSLESARAGKAMDLTTTF